MTQIPMTLNGIKKLKEKLNYLKNIKRQKIIQDIKNARSFGDLKENSEYISAKEEQVICENKIKEIEKKILNANIIDIKKIKPSNKIIFGCTVKIKNINKKIKNKIKKYRIVGDDEANIKNNMLSINSPLARGLIGKYKGNKIKIITPKGKEMKFHILEVTYK